MNVVRERERQRTARHEAAHVACAWLLGEVLDDVQIVSPDRGYVTGSCASSGDPKVGAVVLAVGVPDGHGSGADEFELTELVPDPDDRARVFQVAERVMGHREFIRVRNALWRRLTFADRMGSDEIAKVATASAGAVSA